MKIPPTVRKKLNQIQGKTLTSNTTTGHFYDEDGVDHGRHEIEWMLQHKVVTRTIDMRRFRFVYRVHPNYS